MNNNKDCRVGQLTRGVVKGGASVVTPHRVLARPAAQQREWGLLSALALLFLYLAHTDTPCQRVTWTPVRTHCPIFSKNYHTRRKRWTEGLLQQTCYCIYSQEKNMEDNARWMDWLRLVVWRIQCACTCPLWFGHTFLSFFLPAEYFFVPLSWYEIHDMHCFFSAASFICRQRTNAVD